MANLLTQNGGPQNAAAAQARTNAVIRDLIISKGVNMWQNIFSQAINPATQQGPVNVQLNRTGLITGLLVKISATLANTDNAKTATLTPMGASNILSQIQLVDFNNITRINTTGWHLGLINSAKQPLVFAGAYAPNVPVGYGNNWTVCSAPATIAHNATGAVQMYYYVPCAYAPRDLTGAIFAQLLQAQGTLSLSLNANPLIDNSGGADATLAVYAGAPGGYSGNVTINVWQNYIDKLPKWSDLGMSPPANWNYGPYALPSQDLSVLYQLMNTSIGNLVVGQDNNIPFANYDTFFSTSIIYDNAGVWNVGSDINYFALKASNTTQIFNYGPQEAAFFARNTFFADPPKGCYFFSHRSAPIQTLNYGNLNLVINPSAVTAGAGVLIGFEYMTQASQVQFATALPTPTGV